MTTWILSLMLFLQPANITPWNTTFEATATTIARVATDHPVFKGKDGRARTAALLVSLGWFESRFKPDAIGDHGRSLCMLQVGESNLKALGVTRDAMLTDLETCLRAGLTMIEGSFSVCSTRPAEEWLGHYAAGGQGCRGVRESKHRMALAMKLFKEHPYVPEETVSIN